MNPNTICAVSDCGEEVLAKGWCSRHYEKNRLHGSPLGFKPRRTPEDRFWEKVNKTSGCWLWTAGTNTNGYGRFLLNGSKVGAHRFAYELSIGPIPDGLMLDHICSTPLCVRTDHLRPATAKQNSEHRKMRADNTTGSQGVVWKKNNRKWEVRVVHYGVSYYLGLFTDLNDAEHAARQKRIELFTYNDMDRNRKEAA